MEEVLDKLKQLLSHSGFYLLGILVGEFVQRLYLTLEKLTGARGRNRWKNVVKIVKEVFSNSHGQIQRAVVLLLISLFLCTYGKKIFGASLVNEMIVQAFPVAFVWALLRMSGAFENSLDDMEILEENNAQLGPGLAASYWFGFLSTALKGDIPRNMEEFEQRLQERMENTQTACNIRSFKKMILLIPDDCQLKIKDEAFLREERIFRCQELFGEAREENFQTIRFRFDPEHRRDPIEQNVYWIYESEQYESSEATMKDERNASKILIIFDFPQVLQSAMGCDRDWDQNARASNISSFQEKIKSLIHCNSFIMHENDLLPLAFVNTSRTQHLSTIIRQKIFEEPIYSDEDDDIY